MHDQFVTGRRFRVLTPSISGTSAIAISPRPARQFGLTEPLELLEALVGAGVVKKSTAIDSTYINAHRAAFGGKGGARPRLSVARAVAGGPRFRRLPMSSAATMLTAGTVSDVEAAPALLERASRMRYLLADKGYDVDRLRRSLRNAGAVPVIPRRRNRKRTIRYDKGGYRARHLTANAFCRLKDFRRVATRHDKLAANFLSGVAIATVITFWLRLSLSPNKCLRSQ